MKTDKAAEIYIHVPFCKRKCDYCDFVSFVTDSETQNRYFDMLIKEIEIKAESVGKLPIDSVFFGGGTPSLVNEFNVARVMEALRTHFDLNEGAEITIEMNPNSATLNKLLEYKQAGINRVSIGLQSTDNEELKKLSRLHNYEEFLETLNNARLAGFDNINIDLMSAIPGQTIKSWTDTLKRVVSLNPEHISAYSLIVEEGTPFYEKYSDGKGLPDEDEDREMYHLTKTILKEAGYERYEISNYSKSGYECRHNIGYWTRVPYIGFGIAAASLYNDTRYQKHSDLGRYLKGEFTEEVTELSKEDMMSEFMFLGLRMTRGISLDEFRLCFGEDVYKIWPSEIEKLCNDGLMKQENGFLFLTERGLDISNYCMAEFIF